MFTKRSESFVVKNQRWEFERNFEEKIIEIETSHRRIRGTWRASARSMCFNKLLKKDQAALEQLSDPQHTRYSVQYIVRIVSRKTYETWTLNFIRTWSSQIHINSYKFVFPENDISTTDLCNDSWNGRSNGGER